MLIKIINKNYGTYRGMVRLAIDTLKMWAGYYSKNEDINWTKVKRLVFVCQGNICRSPYGHFLAHQQSITNVASFGYATTTGLPANPQAMKIANERGLPLTEHLTTDMNDFDFQNGDLLLVMEDRHLQKMTHHNIKNKNIQITMLGLWKKPKIALLYDPHSLSDEYFHQCYARIEIATKNVVEKYLKTQESMKTSQ